MELSGLQIFKYLPGAKKTEHANCKECGFPTCMAFALKLGQKNTTISKCPYAPQELVDIINAALKVQQYKYKLKNDIEIGGETVMFRHDKTFVSPTLIAITLYSNDKDFDKKLKQIADYELERIGKIFKIGAINLIDNGNAISAVDKIAEYNLAVILSSNNKEVINSSKQNISILNSEINEETNLLITAKGKNIEEIAEKSKNLLSQGIKNIILNLDITCKSTQKTVQDLTYLRRLAILEKNELFTYPVMVRIEEQNPYKASSIASLAICRYANIIVLDIFNEALLVTLFTLRENIYTDPQKPLQVESKVYEINDPDKNAYVMMTTNFALTYFAVLNEIESAPFSTYLVITPSDGMSVLTAWSAEKFTAEMAAKIIKENEQLKEVKNKKLVIPGLLAHLQEELQETIPEWEIIVGPAEAYKIRDFIKNGMKK